MKIKLFALTALLCASFSVQSQEQFTVAGGGGIKNGSTYSAMLGDLASVCSTDELKLVETTTSGGVQNLDLIKGNKVRAAIIPYDLLLSSKNENATSVANIQTLFALHPEDVHLVVRSGVKVEGGMSLFGKNIGGDKIVYNQAEDLKGRPVGAVGGSVESARIISSILKYGWVVKSYPTNLALISALNSGEIDAGLMVAGSPSAAVKALDGAKLKLIPLRGNSDTAVGYSPSKIQYDNLNSNRGVDTLSTQALFVTRTFRSPEMLRALATLRKCFQDNLSRLQDKEGTHPSWMKVNAEERGKWAWYDLPKLEVVTTPTKTGSKK